MAARALGFFVVLACLSLLPALALAQEEPTATPAAAGEQEPLQAPESVDVRPAARDEEISARLASILQATGWFVNPGVQVKDGVVFLTGQAETDEYKKWAGDLARSTQDVAAVVNQMEVIEPSVWNYGPILSSLREQGRGLARAVPVIVSGLFILLLSWGIARLMAAIARKSLRRRQINELLVDVIARGVGLAVMLAGLYVVFQVAGLTSVALTVLGGTGLLGIILGIAFRDITENFLASIFLSMQSPFRSGDLVEIAGFQGMIQALTTRATLLMTLDGNHVQIPNATVYKSTIQNYTSNPNRRVDFTVGIGYDDAISTVQEVALAVLAQHPAVLKDPEPWILVESLGSATVNLRIYFWLDGSQYSWQKVRSSVIRLVKRAFQDAEVSMPDESREMIFPQGIPVRLIRTDGDKPPDAAPVQETGAASTSAEGGLRSEAKEIEDQVRQSRQPEEGENLLKPANAPASLD